MPADICAPRLEELQSRLGALQERKASVEAEAQAESDAPDFAEVVDIAENLSRMLETLRGVDPAKFKELFRLVVPEIRVESRAAIRPLVFLPLVRVMGH